MKNSIFFLFIVFMVIACKKEQEVITPEPETSSRTFTLTFENMMQDHTFFQSGTTDLILAGESRTYSFVAGIGSYLSFATMLVESNDLFFGFEEKGLTLYHEDGTAVTGDVTPKVQLWDAGTEMNEVLGEGNNQAPRQAGPNFGEREDGVVQLIDSLNDDLIYPVPDSMIRLSLDHDGNNVFVLTIENVSSNESLRTAFAPGVFAVHQKDKYLFKVNEKASTGLEEMAEDGNNTNLWNQISKETGFSSIIGTGIYLVHQAGNPIFTNGEKDRKQGLEILAEYGNPSNLHDTLKNNEDFSEIGIFNNPVGNNVLNLGGKLASGDKYVFSFEAKPGDYLSIASMLVETNDLFFAFADGGLELFPNEIPVSGEVTDQIQLWDAGTEVNEFPGAGCFQPSRNGSKEASDEEGVVRPVSDGFSYLAINDLVRVMIE